MPSPIRYEPVAGDHSEQDSDAFQSQQDASACPEIIQEAHEPMQPDDVPHSTTKPPWQDPVRWCIWGNVAVLAINIIFTVAAVGVSASKGNNHGFGSITMYRGSCKTAQYMKIGLHLLLNVLSVAMTATSSYCCTILMAPSRSDVDEAHAKGTWLSIGVSSWRNFWNLKAQSQVLWVSLLATSMIMQMVYNSVVYSSLNANTYPAIVAPLNFVSNNSVPTSYYEDINCFPESFLNWTIADLRADILNGTFEYLSKEDCLNSYATSYVSNRRTVVLVTKDSLSGDGIPIAGYGYPGGITDMDPSKNMTPNLFASNYDYGQSNVGFDWMCYAGGPDAGSCSGSFINSQGEWNVSGQQCARLTSVNLYNVNPDSLYSDISFDRSSLTGGYDSMERQLNGTGVNWTDNEIKDLLSYVDSNPAPGQMREYINHTSWVKSVQEYASKAKVVQADGSQEPVRGHINVSTYYPSLSNIGNGARVEVTVDHCLSQKSDEECSIFYQVPIALTVIICGVIKVICMLLLLRINRVELLLTIGDAISSFLQRPDPTTRNWCSLSSDVVLSNKECPWNAANKSFEKGNFVPQEYQPDTLQGTQNPYRSRIDGQDAGVSHSPKELRHATSSRVWLMTLAALISYIVISFLFPSLAVKTSSTHPYDTYDDAGSLTSIWHIKG
ncbi:hypothetical protein N7456_006063 [Penicillium angulare]|uniref:DUF6536 domain-containing protein n=1 Tax=Penicillium angulare TaxID=116970 RepID=A0A9W9FZN9_9EURO|nr:hypothetical protein N7456_006063 [Penicillium angulare]